MVHVHISENDRSTPGEGHVDWDTTFKTLKGIVAYDGWMVVEAFGLAPAGPCRGRQKSGGGCYPSEEYLATRAPAFHEVPLGRVTGASCISFPRSAWEARPDALRPGCSGVARVE